MLCLMTHCLSLLSRYSVDQEGVFPILKTFENIEYSVKNLPRNPVGREDSVLVRQLFAENPLLKKNVAPYLKTLFAQQRIRSGKGTLSIS